MTVRLRYLAEINPSVPGWEQIPEDRFLTFVPLEAVWPRRIDFTRARPKSETSTGYTRFMNGDVIVPKITPTFEADRSTWVDGSPTSVLTGTTELHVVRAGPTLESRYLDYIFSSRLFLLDGASQMVGVAGQKRISDEWFRNYRIPMVDLETQREVADYLDAETARIDALISKKRRMLELLDEWSQALHDDWYESLSSAYGLVSIRRWASKFEQGWSPTCDSEPAECHEWGVIRTSAVTSGRFQAENNKRLPIGVARDPRWLLRDGDLLVTRGSGTRSMVGRACVTSVGGRMLTLSDLVYRVRLTQADPEFVSTSLQSSPVRAQIEGSIRTDTGMTLKIRRDDLADVRVPAVPMEHHISETASLTKRLRPLHESKLKAEKQIALLAERRQALITAVVTGEISVPGLAE